MRKKKLQIPQFSKLELAKQELYNGQELLWGEQIHSPITGAGCVAMVLGILSLPGLLFMLGGLITAEIGIILLGMFWSSIGFGVVWIVLKSTQKVTIGLTKNALLFKKGGEIQVCIPLAQIQNMEVNGYYQTNKEGDLVVMTRCKKLNTEDYKFRIENNRYKIEKLPNVMEVKRQIEEAQQQLFLEEPEVIDKIELDGEDLDL